MAYRVIVDFIDKADDDYAYKAGDAYPREGLEVADDYIAELAEKTKLRPALIEATEGGALTEGDEAPEAEADGVEADETPEPEAEAEALTEDEPPKKKAGRPKKNAE